MLHPGDFLLVFSQFEIVALVCGSLFQGVVLLPLHLPPTESAFTMLDALPSS